MQDGAKTLTLSADDLSRIVLETRDGFTPEQINRLFFYRWRARNEPREEPTSITAKAVYAPLVARRIALREAIEAAGSF